MSQYFPKPYEPFGGDINVKVDLSSYATKADIKNISHVDTSSFALKTNLATLKTKVDKLDINKLVPVPVDLSKLRDVVKNDVVKKTDYDKLVAKVYNIDTSGFVLQTKYDTDKLELENKFPDVSNLAKKTKLIELENKIPDTSNLATKTALTAVENKIPSVSSFVKRTDYNNKVTEIENKLNSHNHDKYINTSEFNKLDVDVFNATTALANLVKKTDFDAKLSGLNRKITQNKTKQLLVENELKKLKTFDSSFVIGKSHFEEDGVQNYLVFQPLNKYFKVISSTNYISSWKSKGLSNKTIKLPATSDNNLNPGSCLKQDKNTFNHGKRVNIYIVYELDKTYVKTHPTLGNCLFGAVSITKNADIDKNKYSEYEIRFDKTGVYLLPDGSFGRNVVIFGVDMSSSAHVDSKGKYILILGTGPTQGLGEHSLTAKKLYSINFTDHRKKKVV